MAKILLVEDDNNLREIYEARLQAEGYTIISAKDGEEALVLAKSERPDLIISDVMMPRVSGFEMLDILRNTDGLKDTKIIMLTALGQAEDKTRADSLGADRYLVKSQVTLEDIVKAAQALLGQNEAPGVSTAQPPAPSAAPATTLPQQPAPAAVGVTAALAPASAPQPTVVAAPIIPVAAPAVQPAPSLAAAPPSAASTIAAPPEPPVVPPTPPITPEPGPPPAPAPTPQPEPASPASPLSTNDASGSVTAGSTFLGTNQAATLAPAQDNLTQSSSTEEAAVAKQISDFVNQPAPNSGSVSAAPQATSPLPPAIAGPEPAAAGIIQQNVADSSASSANATLGTPTTPTSTAATDKLVADAVKNLASSASTTPQAPAGAMEQSVTQPQPPAPKLGGELDDAVTVAHKKVISPIVDPGATAKPDLNELLAREGLRNPGEAAHQPSPPPDTGPQILGTPHPPGHVITPTTVGGIDPNSIAL